MPSRSLPLQVEALRVTPPRLLVEQQQQAQLSRAFFRSARAYWLQHEDGGAGERKVAAVESEAMQRGAVVLSPGGEGVVGWLFRR